MFNDLNSSAQERAVATICRLHGREVRISLVTIAGETAIWFRVWRAGSRGVMEPTSQAAPFDADLLAEIHSGLGKALEAARARGLLPAVVQ